MIRNSDMTGDRKGRILSLMGRDNAIEEEYKRIVNGVDTVSQQHQPLTSNTLIMWYHHFSIPFLGTSANLSANRSPSSGKQSSGAKSANG